MHGLYGVWMVDTVGSLWRICRVWLDYVCGYMRRFGYVASSLFCAREFIVYIDTCNKRRKVLT